ncbi:DUF1700 domain-containing protein [Clostridium cibarium]|uniref:DUF1700 domain-containing protein n=1 Tax=Clostridium cibarium TaxID=2762247 RepID=A0ABR8PT93_9CLOT|nr:DUF1700 domain-containing protein [Clostridium cibarium]MBD7911391.1 DUF1700 domain-containing protein [Clostridium cibarium]
MNAKKFLNDLNIALDINKVSEETRKEVIDEFKEHISLAIKSGKDENEVVAALGDPYEISKDYKSIDKELINGNKIKLNKFLQFIKDAISKGILNLFRGYFTLICQVFILLMMLLGVAIFVFGVGCLLGLIFPNINKMILVGYDSAKVSRYTIMVWLGILCPIIGALIVKVFACINRKFRRSVYRDIQKKMFILNRHMRGRRIQ